MNGFPGQYESLRPREWNELEKSVFPHTQHESAAGPEWLSVQSWSAQDAWLWHAFSTRRGGISTAYIPQGAMISGELNLGFTPADSPENVRENRGRFVQAITGNRQTPLVTVHQIHSCRTLTIPSQIQAHDSVVVPMGGKVIMADGILTNQPGILLGIQTADCIPVLVADPVHRAVAAFHAGWRGTVQRIVELGIARMTREFGSDPNQLIAAIGPGIGSCCYTVGQDLLIAFQSQFDYADQLFSTDADQDNQPTLRVDLIAANRRQLLDAGLAPTSISSLGGCTSSQPDIFYSHRASRGHAGRMMSVIGIQSS